LLFSAFASKLEPGDDTSQLAAMFPALLLQLAVRFEEIVADSRQADGAALPRALLGKKRHRKADAMTKAHCVLHPTDTGRRILRCSGFSDALTNGPRSSDAWSKQAL
jgi:hypothetical protein